MQRRTALLSLLLAGTGLEAGAEVRSTTVLRMVRSDWPPYVDLSGTRPRGLDIELIEAVLARADCRLELMRDFPRRRRIEMLIAGQLDLIPAATATPERRQQAWFSAPYREEWHGFACLAERQTELLPLRDAQALAARGVHLLAPKHRLGGEIDVLIEQLDARRLVQRYESSRRGMTMLRHGRGALIVGDLPVLLELARKDGIALTRLPLPELRAPVSLMLSRKTVPAALMARLQAAQQALEADGTLAGIRARYGF